MERALRFRAAAAILVRRLTAGVTLLSNAFAVVSVCVLVALMMLIVVSTTSRYAFNKPVYGDVEITQLMVLVMVVAGMAYVQANGKHLRITLLVEHLSARVRNVLAVIQAIGETVVLVLFAWASVRQALTHLRVGTTTDIMQVPLFYVFLFVAFAFLIWALHPIATLVGRLGKG